MVRIESVNKYFNRKKRNEIHVINNTSLEFGEKGMVALLGPSGCGKTTLLNVIGGLDKVNKGNIFINGQRITGRRSGKIDEIRNLNIGYIFQNYNLIDHMTVYDNVAMVLQMVGIRDKDEIREKVEYALNLVGMYRYRNRFADMLSGGERQRVGIARAIVKNPSIIIADEPTGNLDSANTLEIMNIIKTISRKKLVILVTHEEKLANFYAGRIIRLQDGKVISDEENEHSEALDYRLENKIYLKDMESRETIGSDGDRINIYREKGNVLNIDIVIQDGNIYLRSKDPAFRMEVVDDRSGIELVDDHYRAMSKEEHEQYRLDEEKLSPGGKIRHSSIFNPVTMIIGGFRKVMDYHILKKILLAGFFLSAMFIMYALSSIAGALNAPDSKFVEVNKDYLLIQGKKIKMEDYLAYEKEQGVDYLLPGDSKVSFNIRFDRYVQTFNMEEPINGSLTPMDAITEKDLIAGRMPDKANEIVIDELTLKELKEADVIKQAGILSAKDLIGLKANIPHLPQFTIVGVTDNEAPNIYVQRDQMMNIIACSTDQLQAGVYAESPGMVAETDGESEPGETGSAGQAGQILDVALMQDEIEIKSGRLPQEDYEVILNVMHQETTQLDKEIPDKVNDRKLKVVGFYADKKNRDEKLVTANTVKYNTIVTKDNITVCPENPQNKEQVLQTFRDKGLNVQDTYAKSKEQYRAGRLDAVKASIIFAMIIIVISFIEIYLMMRASFLSRVKEVGVLRAIGVKKPDIYKMFIGEVLAITTLASIPGYLFMAYIIKKLSSVMYFKDIFLFNPQMVILGIAAIFAFNLVFGLLPVFTTLRKTPAAILARSDVNG